MENILGTCVFVYAGGFFFNIIICILVRGENVECKRLPVLSTAGLVMLCRLLFFFFLSFCSPLTKIDF